jgi:low temperature requirement protein LtrA
MLTRFKRLFWQPPRAHGDVIEDRSVSFLELFYDLVYVVVIAQAAHHLAEHVSWRGAAEFAVVFGLIWLAWLNGTLYYDLHGREDGRTRVAVFVQMMLLALLAVFTGDAVGEDGAAFAVVYALYMTFLAVLWYTVRRQDRLEGYNEYLSMTAVYLVGMVVTIAAIVVSAALDDDARLAVWAVVVVAWLVGGNWMVRASDRGKMPQGMAAGEALVERFGLFVIIVLGEVVVGVVDGLSDAERDVRSIATGLLGLMIGFAYWWSYFDFIGRRLPKLRGDAQARWVYLHMPVTLSIAATGAAMVSLIEHAEDARAPESTAWLLGGSVALGLVALVALMTSLRDYDRLPEIYRPMSAAMLIAAGAALLVAWWRPAPWLLALSLVVILSAIWIFSVDRWIRMDDPMVALPNAGE